MSTHNNENRQALQKLKEIIEDEKGKRMVLVAARKPEYSFFIDIVMLFDYTQHKWLIAEAIQTFTSAKGMCNPNLHKPGGTNRILRLILQSVLAPRNSITKKNPAVSIREIQVENGETAFVNPIWPNLNAPTSPSKMGVWIPRKQSPFAQNTIQSPKISTPGDSIDNQTST